MLIWTDEIAALRKRAERAEAARDEARAERDALIRAMRNTGPERADRIIVMMSIIALVVVATIGIVRRFYC